MQDVLDANADAIWLTGDIGEPPSNYNFLDKLLSIYKKPVLFVLGNHDFYAYKINEMKDLMVKLTNKYPHAVYLSKHPGIYQGQHLIMGMDCWAHTGSEPLDSMTWDCDAIVDLNASDSVILQSQLNQLAKLDADRLIHKALRQIDLKTQKVSILTHVPPIDAEHGKFAVKPLQKNRSVFYSEALSQVLHELGLRFSSIPFNVYSGHIHQSLRYQISDNIVGQVGRAYRPLKPFQWISI